MLTRNRTSCPIDIKHFCDFRNGWPKMKIDSSTLVAINDYVHVHLAVVGTRYRGSNLPRQLSSAVRYISPTFHLVISPLGPSIVDLILMIGFHRGHLPSSHGLPRGNIPRPRDAPHRSLNMAQDARQDLRLDAEFHHIAVEKRVIISFRG